MPVGSDEVGRASGGGGWTVRLNAWLAEVTESESVTATEKFVVPEAFGVPLITPVLAFGEAQEGNDRLDAFHLCVPLPPPAFSVAR